jgi:hypothetical protein
VTPRNVSRHHRRAKPGLRRHGLLWPSLDRRRRTMLVSLPRPTPFLQEAACHAPTGCRWRTAQRRPIWRIRNGRSWPRESGGNNDGMSNLHATCWTGGVRAGFRGLRWRTSSASTLSDCIGGAVLRGEEAVVGDRGQAQHPAAFDSDSEVGGAPGQGRGTSLHRQSQCDHAQSCNRTRLAATRSRSPAGPRKPAWKSFANSASPRPSPGC